MGFLTRNFKWKLLALAISATLWVLLNREPDLTTTAAARLEFKNIPAGLEITAGAPDRVLLRVHGPSGHITPSVLRDLAVVLDCSKVTRSGVYTFNLSGSHASLPQDVAVDSSVPSQLQLTFERDIVRDVPVTPRYFRPAPPGYTIASYQIQPATVSVRGAESRVNQLAAVETDPIDLGDATGEIEFRVLAHVPDAQLRLAAGPTALQCKFVIVKNATTKTAGTKTAGK